MATDGIRTSCDGGAYHALMGFQFDEERDTAWRAAFASRLQTLVASTTFDVLAAHAGKAYVLAPYPTEPGDIAIRWFEKSGKEPANGEVRWQALEPDAGDGVSADFFSLGSPEAELAAGLRHFEDHPEGGEGIMVLGRASGELFVHYSGEGALLPLALSFEDYVRVQLAVLGLSGILELFTETREHGMPKGSASAQHASLLAKSQKKTARRVLAAARRLFAEQDLGLVEERANALGAAS